jgi:hypothetical protein
MDLTGSLVLGEGLPDHLTGSMQRQRNEDIVFQMHRKSDPQEADFS